MPAAAKVERVNVGSSGDLQPPNKCKMTNANSINQTTNDPTKIANTIIEKKIRNLEKRKARLLEIKALEDKGHQLESDQITAVKKLDSVVEMIEMLKEINKNVTDSLNEYAKQQKKQIKKEHQDKLIERSQLELERIKLFLRIQKILPRVSCIKNKKNFSQTNISEASINLEDKHIEALKSLANDANKEDLDVYAEKVHMILDGSKKEFSNGMSHLEVKELFTKLIETKYLDDIQQELSSLDSSVVLNKDVSSLHSIDTTPTAVETHSKINEKPQSNEYMENLNQSGSIKQVSEQHVEADLQKDPAVIASGYAYPSFSNENCPVNFLAPNNSGMEYSLIYTTVSVGSIPTQTFTNQNYVGFIPNKVQMFEPTVSIASNNQLSFSDNLIVPNSVEQHDANQQDSSKSTVLNGGNMEQHQVSSEKLNSSGDLTSQENDPKTASANNDASHIMNGHTGQQNKRPNNYRGRGGSRNANSFRGGRGNPKNFGGYFNVGGNQGGQPANTGGNYNGNRPMNKQNGGGRGSYRGSNERGNNIRNHFNPNATNHQGPSVSLFSKNNNVI